MSESDTAAWPHFLLLGAPKCGTTTIARVLEAHPDIAMSRPKEPLFFESEYERGMDFYRREYFAHREGERLVGEARAAHIHLPFAADRIAEELPDARLIVILRDPVERLFSHWWMRRGEGRERHGLQEAIRRNLDAIAAGRRFEGEEGQRHWLEYRDHATDTPGVYLEVGHYAEHLETYLARYPRSRLLVLFFEDLREHADELFGEICRFLEIPAHAALPVKRHENAAGSGASLFVQEIGRRLKISRLVPPALRRQVKGAADRVGKAPSLDAQTRRLLGDYYAEHNRRLEGLVGRDLSAWRH